MTINFNGGIHEVLLFKDGQQFDKTNLPYFFNSITSVEVKVPKDQGASIQITLEPSFDDGVKILSSGLLGYGHSAKGQKPAPQGESTKAKTSTSVENTTSQPAAAGAGSSSKASLGDQVTTFVGVRFRYPGQTDVDGSAAETPWFTGPMRQPQMEINGVDISITLFANATGALLSEIQGTSVFENQPAIDIIRTLAESIKIEVTFDASDTETESILSEPISLIVNEPKMQTIRNILYKFDCFFVMSSGTGKQPVSEIRIRSIKAITRDIIQYSFVTLRNIDPARNVIPIYNLSLESFGPLFSPQGSFGSFQRYVDESEKKVENVAVNPDVVENQRMTGADGAVGTLPKSGEQFGGSSGVTDDSDPELTGSSTPAYSRGEEKTNIKEIEAATKRAAFDGLHYRLTLPGLPRLKPLVVCQVIVGDFIPGLSSAGWLQEVVHTSNNEGWLSTVLFTQTRSVIDKSAVTGFINKPTEDLSSLSPQGNIINSSTLALA